MHDAGKIVVDRPPGSSPRENAKDGIVSAASARAQQVKDAAVSHPKTAIAAGAAVIIGTVAAAVIPAVRASKSKAKAKKSKA